jgi:predicted negative regulator of RcsB-dependent stress response
VKNAFNIWDKIQKGREDVEKILEGYQAKGKKFVVFLVLGFVGLFAYTFFLWSYAEMEGNGITIGFYYAVFYTLVALIFVASVVLSIEKK